MASEIIYWQKAKIQKKYIIELKIQSVTKTYKYPKGVRFSLVCVNFRTKEKILFDNHYPKKEHIHIFDKEVPYNFVSYNQLIDDFKKLVYDNFGVII